MLELHFADHADLKKKGRNFICNGCPKRVQKLRRCREDRWDFTAEDAQIFPVRIHEGGGLYGFCPGKATWDQEAITIFEIMTIACEQKALLNEGGISNQPSWFIELLAWFAPNYDMQKFTQKARMVLGSGDSPSQGKGGTGTKSGSQPTAGKR